MLTTRKVGPYHQQRYGFMFLEKMFADYGIEYWKWNLSFLPKETKYVMNEKYFQSPIYKSLFHREYKEYEEYIFKRKKIEQFDFLRAADMLRDDWGFIQYFMQMIRRQKNYAKLH